MAISSFNSLFEVSIAINIAYASYEPFSNMLSSLFLSKAKYLRDKKKDELDELTRELSVLKNEAGLKIDTSTKEEFEQFNELSNELNKEISLLKESQSNNTKGVFTIAALYSLLMLFLAGLSEVYLKIQIEPTLLSINILVTTQITYMYFVNKNTPTTYLYQILLTIIIFLLCIGTPPLINFNDFFTFVVSGTEMYSIIYSSIIIFFPIIFVSLNLYIKGKEVYNNFIEKFNKLDNDVQDIRTKIQEHNNLEELEKIVAARKTEIKETLIKKKGTEE